MLRSWLQNPISKKRYILSRGRRHTRVLDSFFGESLNRCCLVALSVDELIIDDLNIVIIGRQQRHLVRYRLCIRKSRHVLADTSETNLYLPAV